MIDLRTTRIMVTGGRGFLGKHLVRMLREEKRCPDVLVADLPDYDLRALESIKRAFDDHKPDIVIHLAAVVGGIGANRANPGKFFYDNAIMGIQLIEQARCFGVEKFVCLGTICAYPKFTPVPFREEDLWNGYPEETNAPYGLAKKMLLVQSPGLPTAVRIRRRSIFCQSTCMARATILIPQSSHVIPALIKKCLDAKANNEPSITVWGTGRASREFLYVEDAAEAIVLAAEKYDKPEPMNLGAGFEITIAELVALIVELTGFEGTVLWDRTQPDGQPRRMLSVERAEREIGFKARTNFRAGLQKTIQWYLDN